MPLVRKMAKDLWEIRVMLPGRSARVLFTVVGDTMVLLHGFFKQSRATPSDDLDVTVARLKALTRAISIPRLCRNVPSPTVGQPATPCTWSTT